VLSGWALLLLALLLPVRRRLLRAVLLLLVLAQVRPAAEVNGSNWQSE
jgi:hypothetical protein